MKLHEVQDFIPRDREHTTAGSIAEQILRAANYKGGGNPARAKKIAHIMAGRFHSDILRVIDAELGYSQMKDVDEVA